MPPNESIYIFFDTEVIYLQILFFKVLINLSATDFPSLWIEYHYPATMISLIYCKTHSPYRLIFSLVCD